MRGPNPGLYDEASLEESYPGDSRKDCNLVIPGEWTIA